MTFNFVVDRVVRDKPYPALARHAAEPYTPEWREFVEHWPYTVPVELIEHCVEFGVEHCIYTVDQAYPTGSYYPVHIGWFDYTVDYFALMSDTVHDAVRAGRLRILFYYHEGDNPYRIKERLDALLTAWRLPNDAYRFVSGNTAAEKIDGFIYFADHELLYWRRNRAVAPTEINLENRGSPFTLLSRTHKWWRATSVGYLKRGGLLDGSRWSYNTCVNINDHVKDNPLEVDTLEMGEYLDEFISSGPYLCDDLTAEEHNDHSRTVTSHYRDSYCNIILETHFDCDQSGGAFLTEKTFKPIKHGQPFVVVGAAGSLAALRSLGYRTFDSAIDTTYDRIEDNTQRWLRIVDAIQQIKTGDLPKFFDRCLSDVRHNQQVFLASKKDRLNRLMRKLKND
jgi:hypothetical protein